MDSIWQFWAKRPLLVSARTASPLKLYTNWIHDICDGLVWRNDCLYIHLHHTFSGYIFSTLTLVQSNRGATNVFYIPHIRLDELMSIKADGTTLPVEEESTWMTRKQMRETKRTYMRLGPYGTTHSGSLLFSLHMIPKDFIVCPLNTAKLWRNSDSFLFRYLFFYSCFQIPTYICACRGVRDESKVLVYIEPLLNSGSLIMLKGEFT